MGIYFKIANVPADKGPHAVAYYLQDGRGELDSTPVLDFSDHAATRAQVVQVGEVIVVYQRVHRVLRVVTHVVQRLEGVLLRDPTAPPRPNGGFPWQMPVRVIARLKPDWFAHNPPQYNRPLPHLMVAQRNPDPGAFFANDVLWDRQNGTPRGPGFLTQSGAPIQMLNGYAVRTATLLQLVQRPSGPNNNLKAYEWTDDFVQIVNQNSLQGVNN